MRVVTDDDDDDDDDDEGENDDDDNKMRTVMVIDLRPLRSSATRLRMTT
jgi:hypothetical protein